MKRLLHATVGLPYSGKTTWALQQGAPIVCPDAIRLALHGQRFVAEAEPFVWSMAKLMVRALFRAGHHTVILDATNTTPERRAEWEDPDWVLLFHCVRTPAEVCIERANAAGDEEILPVIDRMAAKLEFPD